MRKSLQQFDPQKDIHQGPLNSSRSHQRAMPSAPAAQDVAGKQNESSQSSPNQTFEDLNFDSINDSTHEEDKHMSFDQHEGSKPAQLQQVELAHQNKSMLLTSTQQP